MLTPENPGGGGGADTDTCVLETVCLHPQKLHIINKIIHHHHMHNNIYTTNVNIYVPEILFSDMGKLLVAKCSDSSKLKEEKPLLPLLLLLLL